jgi:hypothetical protein
LLPEKPGYCLIFTCHYPCSRLLKKRPGLSSCTIHNCKSAAAQPSKIIYWDLLNREQPDERSQDLVVRLDQLSKEIETREVVLISEHGFSRAATLALLWLAFRGNRLPGDTFTTARAEFMKIYPSYQPDPGWILLLEREWKTFH